MKSLDGIRILDLSRVLAGPYCTMLLADLGAEVIKIEQPGKGDDTRSFGPFIGEESAYFMSINRGKKSITLDLKSNKDKKIFWELVEKVDIIVENFRPGVMEKMGLGYEEIKKINPRIIYAAISGFGHTGPYSNRPAYDMIVQAMGGIMSITGEPDRPPVRIGTSVGDITAALFGTIGILSALNARQSTGLGQKVDVSMLDSQVAILENAIARYEITGKIPKPMGTTHPSIAPFQAFPTSDDYIIIAAGNDSLWEKLCLTMEINEYIHDIRFKTNGDRVNHIEDLVKVISQVTTTKTTAEWLVILESAGIPAAEINTIDKVITNEQVLSREMIVQLDHPVAGKTRVSGNPIKLSETPIKIQESAPLLDQHKNWVLREVLKYTEEEIDEFNHDEM